MLSGSQNLMDCFPFKAKLPTSEIAATINEFRSRHLSELTEVLCRSCFHIQIYDWCIRYGWWVGLELTVVVCICSYVKPVEVHSDTGFLESWVNRKFKPLIPRTRIKSLKGHWPYDISGPWVCRQEKERKKRRKKKKKCWFAIKVYRRNLVFEKRVNNNKCCWSPHFVLIVLLHLPMKIVNVWLIHHT